MLGDELCAEVTISKADKLYASGRIPRKIQRITDQWKCWDEGNTQRSLGAVQIILGKQITIYLDEQVELFCIWF